MVDSNSMESIALSLKSGIPIEYILSNDVLTANRAKTHDPNLGKVMLYDQQYFGNVTLSSWEFYIGGYQPAQKWLKDRRGSTLSMEEIQHYQRIIVALVETERIMGVVDRYMSI